MASVYGVCDSAETERLPKMTSVGEEGEPSRRRPLAPDTGLLCAELEGEPPSSEEMLLWR